MLSVLQPLTAQSGYPELDVRSEFILALFPIILNLLRSRIPLLLDRPALLAHTVYQTVLFDDAVREAAFVLARTSAGADKEGRWEGLTGVILREEGWFEKWLVGEKKCTYPDSQSSSILMLQSSTRSCTVSSRLPKPGRSRTRRWTRTRLPQGGNPRHPLGRSRP
jgi:hypothetical protein